MNKSTREAMTEAVYPPQTAYERANRSLDRGPEPSEPALGGRARELLGYLQELEQVQGEIRYKLMGRAPSQAAAEGPNKRTDEPCIDELLAVACTLAANLVGEQKTILARI